MNMFAEYLDTRYPSEVNQLAVELGKARTAYEASAISQREYDELCADIADADKIALHVEDIENKKFIVNLAKLMLDIALKRI